MKILISGHQGFIGTHLVKVLKENHELFGADKKVGMNITSDGFLLAASKIKPQVIVHLAAECSTAKSISDPFTDFKNNAIGTFMVCEMARITGAKILYTSTCKVIQNFEGLRTPYGLSKYVGELYLKEYNGIYGVEYVINRPGTIYGIGQNASPESGWLSWFIKAKKDNRPITIFGDGNQIRDVLWVEDYVKLLVDQIEHWEKYAGMTFDVGGGEKNAVSLLQILSFLKYKNYKFAPRRQGDIDSFISDNNLVQGINGWKPSINWEEGIKRLL